MVRMFRLNFGSLRVSLVPFELLQSADMPSNLPVHLQAESSIDRQINDYATHRCLQQGHKNAL